MNPTVFYNADIMHTVSLADPEIFLGATSCGGSRLSAKRGFNMFFSMPL